MTSDAAKPPVPLLIISGPIGVGKSSVGSEVSDLRDEQGVAHTFIDLDQLRYTYPKPVGDRFGTQLGLANLRDVWRNCAAAGSRNLVIASVVEDWDDVENIASVIPRAQPIVC